MQIAESKGLDRSAGATARGVGTLEAGARGLTRPELRREKGTRNQSEWGLRDPLGGDPRAVASRESQGQRPEPGRGKRRQKIPEAAKAVKLEREQAEGTPRGGNANLRAEANIKQTPGSRRRAGARAPQIAGPRGGGRLPGLRRGRGRHGPEAEEGTVGCELRLRREPLATEGK